MSVENIRDNILKIGAILANSDVRSGINSVYEKCKKLKSREDKEGYLNSISNKALLKAVFRHDLADTFIAMDDCIINNKNEMSALRVKMLGNSVTGKAGVEGGNSDDEGNIDALADKDIGLLVEELNKLLMEQNPEDKTASEEDIEPELDEDIKEDEKARIEELKKAWGGKLRPVIQSILASYDKLYKPGYGLETPSGILTDKGIIKSTTNGKRVFTGDRATDIEVFNALQSVTGDAFKIYAQEGEEPDIATIANAGNKPVNYINLHIKFMFAHIKYCTGRLSLKKYMTENGIVTKSEADSGKTGKKVNPSDTKVIQYSDVRGWIKEVLEDYFYKAYIDSDVTDDITQDNIEKTNHINEIMSHSLKNVVAVVGRKNDVNTRLRICTDFNLDANKVISALASKLNIGTASSVVVKQMENYSDGVLDINIIYNDRVYSQDSLFAYQVIDILREQGIRPRWDNVVLGKRDNGTIMTYNFKDSRNTVYGMYASSRSGKGVMTLNLLASALADGCKVMYIDGKPDMGEVLVDVAWKSGLDAAVYNGRLGKGTESLENRGNCIRAEEPLMSADKIPDGIFMTEELKQDFILVCTYLRGLELLFDVAAERASGFDTMDKNDWLVAVFDECEAFSSTEATIMGQLSEAEARIKSKTDEKGKKINPNSDPAFQFIQNFRSWGKLIKSKAVTCFKATFGYAKVTVFFVWQSSYYTSNPTCKPSILLDIVNLASAQMVKIIGRGALQAYSSNTFGTPASVKDSKWYDERFSGDNGGFFAIGRNVNSEEMRVFRPFNVYSDADHRDLIIENAKKAGLSEQDLIGTQLNDDGSVKKEVGFEGYVDTLLSQYGMTAASQINVAYAYLNDFIVNSGKGSSLNEYMFNAHDFLSESDKVQVEKLNLGVNADGIGEEGEGEEEEEIHFGDDAVDTKNVINRNGGGYADEIRERRKLLEEAKNLKIMPTRKVAALNPELMEMYCKRIAMRSWTHLGKFNLADRVPRSPVGLNILCILLSNLVYIECEFNQKPVSELLDRFASEGYCNDASKKAIALGYIKLVYEKKISYDYMPNKVELGRIQSIGLNWLNGGNLSREQAYGSQSQGMNGGGQAGFNFAQQTDTNSGQEQANNGQNQEQLTGDTVIESDGGFEFEHEGGFDNGEEYFEGSDDFTGEAVRNNGMGSVNTGGTPVNAGMGNDNAGGAGFTSDSQIDTGMGDMEEPVDFDYVNIPINILNQRKSSDEVSERSQPVYETPNKNSSFYTRPDGRRGITPKSFSDVGVMNSGMYAAVAVPHYETAERFKRKLYENKYGASYEFKQRWDWVLKAMVGLFRTPSMITKVSILSSMVCANTKCIDVSYAIDDEYDIQLEDIINFRRMFKKIPFIKELVLDEGTYEILLNEYGATTNALWSVFAQNRALNRIIVLEAIISNGQAKDAVYSREDFASRADEIEEHMADMRYRRDLEQMTASKNPRFNDKPAGYKNRIWENTKKYSGNAWREAGKNMSGDKISPIKSLGYIGVTGLVLAVGVPLSLAGKAGNLFKTLTGR